METCHCCNEQWFQISLKQDICAVCVRNEKKHAPNDSLLFSNANCLDPGPVSDLSALSEIEKMLIACVHVHQQIAHMCGHQYWYTDHVVCFAQNISKM